MITLATDLHPDYYPGKSPYNSDKIDTSRLPMYAVFDVDETINGIPYKGSAHVTMFTSHGGEKQGYLQNFYPALGSRHLTDNARGKLAEILVAELRDRYAAITPHDYLVMCRAELTRKWDYYVDRAVEDRDLALTNFDTRFPDVATRDTPNDVASPTA